MAFLNKVKAFFSAKRVDQPTASAPPAPPAPIDTSTDVPVTTVTPPTPISTETTAPARTPAVSADSTAPDAPSYAEVAATPAFDANEVKVVFVLGGPGAGKPLIPISQILARSLEC